MKFLAVTDLHYADRQPHTSDRDTTDSIIKLGRAIKSHLKDCDFIINLGDTVDNIGKKSQSELLCEVCGVLKCGGAPFYSMIGNHDTSLDKREYCRLLEMPWRYYSFISNGYKCVVLDSSINNIDEPFPAAEIDWKNCNIDPLQLEWLEREIDTSDVPVVVFTHAPLMMREWDIDDIHLIRNRAEVADILEKSGKVKAVFSGHYHEGCYGERNGIPHIVFGSICVRGHDTFSVVELLNGHLKIDGYGLNKSVEYII
ncbi:MAG: hypothetical protein GX107_06135 [Clostridiales bacterium]|jgi:3',5'-cyclic AMP phosphodiesterase CpdA|nr:hypothetical protein [Clostridiales bacterium]